MPTTRKRRTRSASASLSPLLQALFEVRTGWNNYSDKWLQEQWDEHGEVFLQSRTFKDMCWAEMMLGLPNRKTTSR